MAHHEADVLSRRKVSRKLMEELCAVPPVSRPVAIRLKPSRCVLWGLLLPPISGGSWLVVTCHGVWLMSPLPLAPPPLRETREDMVWAIRAQAAACGRKLLTHPLVANDE